MHAHAHGRAFVQGLCVRCAFVLEILRNLTNLKNSTPLLTIDSMCAGDEDNAYVGHEVNSGGLDKFCANSGEKQKMVFPIYGVPQQQQQKRKKGTL